MLVLGGSYHCGFNFGFNIAEAINYATLGWLAQLLKSKCCSCSKSSVKASHREILDNLLKSTINITQASTQTANK
jgi:jumonji domain-containing protein 2